MHVEIFIKAPSVQKHMRKPEPKIDIITNTRINTRTNARTNPNLRTNIKTNTRTNIKTTTESGTKADAETEASLFWADQIADEIISRKHFRYLDHSIPKFEKYIIKTSASLSGVLHIGRLSDTIRGDSVRLALQDRGVKAELIWVAEDMDPLRKIPEGVPKSFEKYIGLPVTDVPDPFGKASSYASHFMQEYLEVVDQYVNGEMKTYSMMEEYRKGRFDAEIKKLMHHFEEVKQILSHYHDSVPQDWTPWVPCCENCQKIATTRVISASAEGVEYECKDYKFESATALGCSHKGFAQPGKTFGKLRWKSEWAAQWAAWNVSSEGAGKEYIVPNSAFWVNAEICEKVLNFPAPVPIFYEHIMVDGKKMSASLGNVAYPSQWTEVATPDILRYFYNKRLMKTRSFSWTELPSLWDDFDKARTIAESDMHSDRESASTEKEAAHISRLVRFSVIKDKVVPPASFSHAAFLTQIFMEQEKLFASLKKTGHWEESKKDAITERLAQAKRWLELYAPEEEKFALQQDVSSETKLRLSQAQKTALAMLADTLGEKHSAEHHAKQWNEQNLFQEFYSICRDKAKVEPKEFFKAAYLVLLNKERGPKLAPFILAIGKEKCAEMFRKAAQA